MQAYEFEGKTTEEAIENASQELNLPVEELSIDVIEPGSAGIFGLVGGKKARIKVSVKSGSDLDEGVRIAEETLRNILALIPVEATVSADQGDGRINLHIEGDRSGLLIGRKGKTLDALQFIVNKIVNKALDRKLNIVLDSENYRKRRKDSLTQLALKMGDKAKRIKKPVTTNPLNPHDRRIVHLALKEDEGLDTKSRGEGLLKKVVIIPKNN
ncbi:MAG: RNA-binding cell elongation regulator Jag/EloR [Desulfobacteraceae bacterium]|jgi:spoIIIJ-associated protein